MQLADYTKVNEAKAKIPADLSVYTDDSVKDLKDVLAGIDENLPRSKQKEVDAYADAIEAAIGNLVLKQQNGGGTARNTGQRNIRYVKWWFFERSGSNRRQCKCFCYGSIFTFTFGNCCPYETENVLESFGKR